MMTGIQRKVLCLRQYAMPGVFQITLLLLVKCLYPQEDYFSLIQMEFTGVDPLGYIYFFSVGILLLFSSLEISILFQSIQGFFKRYCYLYGRISGNKRKKLAEFVLKRMIMDALYCMSIHLFSGIVVLYLEYWNGNFFIENMETAKRLLKVSSNLLVLESFHFITLIIWGSFIVLLNCLKIRRQYIWMLVCLLLCIAPLLQKHLIMIPFLPFDQNLCWSEQWGLKMLCMMILLLFQYILLTKGAYCPMGEENKS